METSMGPSLACASCKHRKGKCDKIRPQCSYCAKYRKTCVYPPLEKLVSSDSKKWKLNNASKKGNQRRFELSRTLPDSNGNSAEVSESVFPPVFFLDAGIFQLAGLEIPRPGFAIPIYVSDLLGDSEALLPYVDKFFNNIHPWMPIVGKQRFYQHLMNPLTPPRADFVLLLLTMKLVVWSPALDKASQNPQTMLYRTVRRYQSELEIIGTLSIQTTQAGILLSIYELGHAIYPSAYISVALCARYAVTLGFEKELRQQEPKTLPWYESEERRRSWWAILILDRFINLGNPSRMLATEDPKVDDILPGDDSAWDQGIVPTMPMHTTSSTSVEELGRFARFAQATYLLGRVLRHVSEKIMDDAFHEQHAVQLNRTLMALSNLFQYEGARSGFAFCTQTATCFSALLILQQPLSSDSERPIEEINLGTPIISSYAVCTQTAVMAQEFFPGGSVLIEHVSPFILHLLYHSIVTLTRKKPEYEAVQTEQLMMLLRKALSLMEKRWSAAGSYLAVIKAREALSYS